MQSFSEVFTRLAFTSIPQSVGPSTDLIAAVSKVFDIEINSADSSQIPYDDSQSALAIRQLTSAFFQLKKASQTRLQQLKNSRGNPSVEEPNGSSIATDDLVANGFLELYALITALAEEIFESLSILDELEALSAQKKEKGGTGTDGDADEGEGENNKASNNNAKGKPKPEADDSHLTPEQRAKAEAKRKAKAEKALSKALQKESKKSASLVLGAGTSILRSYLKNKLSELGQEAVDGRKGVEILLDLINPFDLSEGGFAATAAKVVEQLNAGGKRKPKIPKGARDFNPDQMRIREQVSLFNIHHWTLFIFYSNSFSFIQYIVIVVINS